MMAAPEPVRRIKIVHKPMCEADLEVKDQPRTVRSPCPGDIVSPYVPGEYQHAADMTKLEAAQQYNNFLGRLEKQYHAAPALRPTSSSDDLRDRLNSPPVESEDEQAKMKGQDSWHALTRGLLLCEGDFLRWHKRIQDLLHCDDTWKLSQHCRNPFISLESESGDRTHNHGTSYKTWAINVVLTYVNPIFLASQPIDRPVTLHELFGILENGAKPFRFLDLPRELRNNIYELMVDSGKHYEELQVVKVWPNSRRDWGVVRSPIVCSLCAVSAEFREEVSKFHYSSNSFHVVSDWGRDGSPEDIREWANVVGRHDLSRLRNLNAKFGYYKVSFDSFHVAFVPEMGLRAEAWKVVDYDYSRVDESLNNHVGMIKRHQEIERYNSTGVFEFFTLDPDSLRRAIHGDWIKGDDLEGEEIDERNAYQVAYGRTYTWDYGQCPW